VTDVPDERESYLSEFAQLEKEGSGRGHPWVHQIRLAAISRFAELGFPTTRHEDWKYTNLSPITKVPFKIAGHTSNGITSDNVHSAAFGEWERSEVVFVNGHYRPELSSLGPFQEGLKVGSLAEAIAADPDCVEMYLTRYADYQAHPFIALNTAFVENGAFVWLERNTTRERPIHLLFLSVPGKEPTVCHPRNLIVVGDNSQATIVESYVGVGNGLYFTNAVSEIVAGENSIVDHYRFQWESDEALHVSATQALQKRSSSFSSHSVSVGGALVRNDAKAVLDGEGADCTLNGLYLAVGQQHVDNYTRIDHVKPHGTSRELYKGILDGQSSSVFNGRIVVWKDAQKTDARQTNKNLLLSDGAEINSKPQLEILADDVKCTHGTTVGQLGEDELFYLRSRGMNRDVARSLLTYGFASDTVGRIKIDAIRSRLERLLLTRFQKNEKM
jgi:Fe-S cluster assembly protein SufD